MNYVSMSALTMFRLRSKNICKVVIALVNQNKMSFAVVGILGVISATQIFVGDANVFS